MKDLPVIQRQEELEEKAGNEQQLRRELSMVAQDNDAKHGNMNSRQVAYQEDDNLKLQNENIPECKKLHEQIQAYFSSTLDTLDQKFKQELDRMAKDAYRENTALRSQLAIDLWISLRKVTDFSKSWHAGWKRLGTSHLEYFTCFMRMWSRSWEPHSGPSRDVFCFFAKRTQSWG